MAVDQRDETGIGRERRQQLLDMGGRAVAGLAGALGGVPAGIQAVGRCHGEQAGARYFVENLAVRLDRLGGYRASIDECETRAWRRRLQPVAAGDDGAAGRVVDAALRLRDRAGGQPQIDRTALDVVEPLAVVDRARCRRAAGSRTTSP